ncbi:MAG: hypothetical protein EXS37_13460 [Opitutus sp.]|nr:hypothetical protein [Opitutus sp.]
MASFTEDARAFFFGREKETEELVRLIRRNTLTILFGQSGLGKSSLLQAGAFPQLREADFLPLYLRLDHSINVAGLAEAGSGKPGSATPATPPPLADQVKSALTAAFASAGADAPGFRASETLWEYFHRKDIDIWSAKNRLLTPVLAFDQFEEIFTLGRATDAQRERGRAFLVELADLVENRAPAELRAKFDSGELDIARFNFEKPSCQVVLSLREDFLPDLESLKHEMRSIMQSRMRVRRLNGTQALEIVQKPAPHLLADGVAERIVEFVAGVRGGSVERLTEMEVEPALLSVICRELNERRRTLGQPQISADLVSGNRREILTDFYERSVADLPEAMRAFVEDHLLTKSGFRDNLALETALEFPGVTRPLIDTLVARRLVRLEDRLGVQRVELTHDVLAEVIRAARDTRQQRLALEAAREKERLTLAAAARAGRRQRFVIVGLVAAVAALLVGAFFGLRAQRRAEQLAREKSAEASRTDFNFGSRLLEENKTAEGLAYLVRAAQSDRTNHRIGPRLLSALAYRSFAEPVGAPIASDTRNPIGYYLNDRQFAVVEGRNQGGGGSDAARKLSVWDIETGRQLRTMNRGSSGGLGLALGGFRFSSGDGRLLAAPDADGTVTITNAETGGPLYPALRQASPLLWFAFSPDNRWFLTSGTDETVSIWDLSNGTLRATLPIPKIGFGMIAVSPDSRRFATTGGALRLWQLPGGTPLTGPLPYSGQPNSDGNLAEFTPDGKFIFVVNGGGAQFYDGFSGAPVGSRMPQGGAVPFGRISHGGTRLVTYSSDGAVNLWEVPSGKPAVPAMQHGADIFLAWFTPDDRHVVTRTGDDLVRVWHVATGQLALEPFRVGEGRTFVMHPSRPEILSHAADGSLRRWQIAPSAARPLEIPADPGRLAMVRDAAGGLTAQAIYPTRMVRIDLLTGVQTGDAIEFPAPITSALLAPNEQRLLVDTVAGKLELWQLGGPSIVRRELGPTATTFQARFSPDSAFLARGARARNLTVWDAKTGDVLLGPRDDLGLASTRFSTIYSATSRSLLAENNTIRTMSIAVVDLAGRTIGEPIRNDGGNWGLALSPDEQRVAIGNNRGLVRLWDVASSQVVGEPFVPRVGVIRGISFDRSGQRLLTWNRGEIYLWDVATRQRLLPILPGGVDVISAVFSPDERRIASYAATRGEVRIFDTATGALLGEPFLGAHSTSLAPLSFTADGRFLITQTPPAPGANTTIGTTGLLVWPVPLGSSGQPLPDWLLRFATAVAGGGLDANGALQDRMVGAEMFDEARAELAKLPADAPYAEWGRWLLADRTTRPIGPGLKITAAEAEKLRAGAGMP